jgi:hypothetical protein
VRSLLLVLPLLAACAAPPPLAGDDPANAPQERRSGASCHAGKARGLVGRARSDAAEKEARRLSGAGAVRWVPMGALVTMDYRTDRLNIRLDEDGRILSLDCG